MCPDEETGSSSAGPCRAPRASASPSGSSGVLRRDIAAAPPAPPAHDEQRHNKQDGRRHGVVDVMQVVLPLGPVRAHRPADQREHQDPRDAPGERQHREAPEGHPRHAGGQRDERADDRQHPGEEHRRIAVLREPPLGPGEMLRLDVERPPVLLEQLDAPVVADRVRDPRADEVGDRPHRHGREQRVLALGDVEAREEHRRLRRDRDERALGRHQQEDPGQAEVADHSYGEVHQRVRDRGEDGQHAAAQASVSALPVPLFDPGTPLAPLRDELHAAAARVLDGGRYVLGPEVEAFEREFSRYVGVRECVGVANGTEAITIALRALGVGEGDEVVVPSFTFYASVEAIPPTGAQPVFCDVDPATFCVTADTVRAALTPRTKAVIAVHLFGNVAPVAQIAALGVPVLEDAAQAAGSLGPEGRPGALGTIATFSFYPTKNLGAFGDAGAVLTRDAELADRIAMLRFHGSRDKVTYEQVGYNSRLDELQAAILRVQLPHLDAWADHRRQAARWYADAGLGGWADLPQATAGADPAWHLYVIRTERSEELERALPEAGIGARSYYRVPVHRQPAMAHLATGAALPGTDRAASEHLAIPIRAAITREPVPEVVDALARCASGST